MACLPPDLSVEDWRRICDALRYLGRDLHHRSFAVTSERRELLWEEMDRCLALADRLAAVGVEASDGVPESKASLDASAPLGGAPHSSRGER